ncbi:MAG: Gfo/Idh/MocA family oxidoreductase [Fimbriimonadaceae bacterium]|nr:Gfo/Idh/MocA family oxidoreductase [Fimbriimonadaceae bacterium]
MDRKVRVGIIGTGSIAQTCHMPAYTGLAEKCEIVAICDIDPVAEKAAKTKFGVTRTYKDYRDLIADPEIDAVSVTTPNAVHKDPTVRALQAGKHVLCEKPLAMNAAESRAMCQAARDSGKILQVALQQRFSGPMRFMKEYIDAGHMGDIYYARAQALRRRGVPGWGVFIDKEKQGGGPLIDIGVHILDMTLHLMGYPKPVSASAKTWNMLGTNPELFNNWGDYDRAAFTVEDFAVGLIKFDNGAVVVLESSFMGNLDGDPFATQLFGTKAGAIVKGWGDDAVSIFTEQDKQLFNLKPINVPKVESAYTAEVHAFIDAILQGGTSPVPGEEGLILNAIFDAMYKSSDSGKEEPIDVSF